MPRNKAADAKAAALAERTADAYSASRYVSWKAVAAMLLGRGYTERQAEAILRSKWTRWAGDACGKKYGRCTSADLARYLDDKRNRCTLKAVEQMVVETFSEAK